LSRRFLDRLAGGPLLCDGGYYLELERRCLGSYASHIPMAVLDHPEGVLELHREFARAGADVLQAMTWGVKTAGDIGREREQNRAAVRLAREAAGPERFVAGTISPAVGGGIARWGGLTDADRVLARDAFARSVAHQAGEGVDLFIVETFSTVDEAALAIPLVREAGVPAVVTLTFRETELTRDGYPPAEAAKRLVDLGADAVGVNCMRPWRTTVEIARQMRAAVSAPTCTQPTAYELEPGEVFNRALHFHGLWGGVEPRVETRFAMAQYAAEARSMGIGLIGACCGALPYHIRAMAEALGKPTDLPDIDRGYRAPARTAEGAR
jgi:betaine-homocysteine S-methyltransferase